MSNPETQVIHLQQQLDRHRLAVSMLRTQLRNVITDIEDGEIDEALEALKQLVEE